MKYPTACYDTFKILRVVTPDWVAGAIFRETNTGHKLVRAAPILFKAFIKGFTWKGMLEELKEGQKIGWLSYSIDTREELDKDKAERLEMVNNELGTTDTRRTYRNVAHGR